MDRRGEPESPTARHPEEQALEDETDEADEVLSAAQRSFAPPTDPGNSTAEGS
jgi:hypothetical protein